MPSVRWTSWVAQGGRCREQQYYCVFQVPRWTSIPACMHDGVPRTRYSMLRAYFTLGYNTPDGVCSQVSLLYTPMNQRTFARVRHESPTAVISLVGDSRDFQQGTQSSLDMQLQHRGVEMGIWFEVAPNMSPEDTTLASPTSTLTMLLSSDRTSGGGQAV